MKIVIPVSKDKETIFQRTGQAPFFAIYEDDNLIDVIVNAHAASHEEGGHHHEEHNDEEVNHHRDDIENLKGCDIILARAIGPNMGDALKSIGLKIKKSDGEIALEVINKFLSDKL